MKMFPILATCIKRNPLAPHAVPWRVVETWAPRLRRNHGGQTVERLAERGGCSWGELYCAFMNYDLGKIGWTDEDELACTRAMIKVFKTMEPEWNINEK